MASDCARRPAAELGDCDLATKACDLAGPEQLYELMLMRNYRLCPCIASGGEARLANLQAQYADLAAGPAQRRHQQQT